MQEEKKEKIVVSVETLRDYHRLRVRCDDETKLQTERHCFDGEVVASYPQNDINRYANDNLQEFDDAKFGFLFEEVAKTDDNRFVPYQFWHLLESRWRETKGYKAYLARQHQLADPEVNVRGAFQPIIDKLKGKVEATKI
jgi:hypothetical protein